MKNLKVVLTAGLLLGASLSPSALAQTAPPITEQEAHSIAVDAYIYFYALVTMDVTRKQFTNIEAGKEIGKGPMNMFVNVPQYPPADFKGVDWSMEPAAYYQNAGTARTWRPSERSPPAAIDLT